MICWCDMCYSLVSWSVRPGRVSCDGCDAEYREPIDGPTELKGLLAAEGTVSFSFAPDQSEAVAAVIASGPHPTVTSLRVVDGLLGIDSLSKMPWGSLSALFAQLPNLREVDLVGQFEELETIPSALETLRLRGSVDRSTVDAIASIAWPKLTTLELGLAEASSFAPLIDRLDAPTLQRLWVNGADLSAVAWAALQKVVGGLTSLKLTFGVVHPDVALHVDELAPSLTHLNELWLPEDCFTADLARLVPHADCSY